MLHKRRQPMRLVSLLVVIAVGQVRLLMAQDPETAKSESTNISDRAGARRPALSTDMAIHSQPERSRGLAQFASAIRVRSPCWRWLLRAPKRSR